MHSWPELAKAARVATSAARSRSASARTSSAFLPPSSSEQPISRSPQRRATWRPVCVEPVNMMKSACSTTCGPITGPSPATTWTSDSGMPAWAIRSVTHNAVSAVWLSGLTTTPLPAIRAGIASLAARVSG